VRSRRSDLVTGSGSVETDRDRWPWLESRAGDGDRDGRATGFTFDRGRDDRDGACDGGEGDTLAPGCGGDDFLATGSDKEGRRSE
jgi:hypothetical protein